MIRRDHFDVSSLLCDRGIWKGKWAETQGEGEVKIAWVKHQNREDYEPYIEEDDMVGQNIDV